MGGGEAGERHRGRGVDAVRRGQRQQQRDRTGQRFTAGEIMGNILACRMESFKAKDSTLV